MIAKAKEYCMKVDICANCTGEMNGAGDPRCLACHKGSNYVEVPMDEIEYDDVDYLGEGMFLSMEHLRSLEHD